MTEKHWDKESLAELQARLEQGQLDDYAGFASLEELYRSICEAGNSPDPEIGECAVDIKFLLRDLAYARRLATGGPWDLPSLYKLRHLIYHKRLKDFAGFSSREELYRSIEALGDSPDWEVRSVAMSILFSLDRERAFTHLVRCLKDPDEWIRATAVELLTSYEGERITPLLIPVLLQDPSPLVRGNAATTLGYAGTLEALPALKHAAEHDHECETVTDRNDMVSVCAQMAIKYLKARHRPGSAYQPGRLRSLAEAQAIDEEETLD
jgi:hypothetical protein